MSEISFFIPGTPKPAGSKNAFGIKSKGIYTGRCIVTDSSGQAGKDWRASVAHEAHIAFRKAEPECEPWTCPIELRLEFVMPRPKGHYGTGKNADTLKPFAPKFHTSKPDATKLCRAVEDALSKVLWRDDSQICVQKIFKAYGNRPGCQVTVKEVI